MSSLGFQVVYRLLNDPAYPRLRAERAFLPDDVDAWRRARLPLLTYESQTAVGLAPAILFSVAYELELSGLFSCLELAAVPVLLCERGAGQPHQPLLAQRQPPIVERLDQRRQLAIVDQPHHQRLAEPVDDR